MPGRTNLLLLVVLLAMPVPLAAVERPLSAIDWLSDTVAAPPARTETAVQPPGTPPPIEMTVLPTHDRDGVGTLPLLPAGVDRQFWAASSQAELIELLQGLRPETLPVLVELLPALLQARLAPPAGADGTGGWLLARVDKLLELGMLEPAATLLAAAGTPTPELFRRSFDIALLLGDEDRACNEQRAMPGIAPTLAAQVFCLARGGDWPAADLVLATAEVLGQVPPAEAELLARFLDPVLFEDAAPLPVPQPLTPLGLRMLEAIGEPVPGNGLPLPFAWGDLTPATGWKARLDAAERLARAGAIPPARLFALYSERRPAASGGVWQRVAAVQKLATALAQGDAAAVAAALAPAWAAMAAAELEVSFAGQFAATLAGTPLTGDAAALAFRVALLGPDYESAARQHVPTAADEVFLIAIASGAVPKAVPAERMARALAPAFAAAPLPPMSAPLQAMLDDGHRGQAALVAIERISVGVAGDLRAVTEGLILLRQLGMADIARRAALQLLLLERRG